MTDNDLASEHRLAALQRAQDEVLRLEGEVARLRAHIERVEEWQREGEAHFANNSSPIQNMFSLAAWWTDRPWRRRETL